MSLIFWFDIRSRFMQLLFPFAFFLELFIWVGPCLDHLKKLSIRVLIFVVDFTTLPFARTCQQRINFLFLDHRVDNPLWHLPVLNQSIIDFVL